MTTRYTYPSSSFTGPINLDYLQTEVNNSSITKTLDYLEIQSTNVQFIFNNALTAGEQTTLDGIISSYDGNNVYIIDDVNQQKIFNYIRLKGNNAKIVKDENNPNSCITYDLTNTTATTTIAPTASSNMTLSFPSSTTTLVGTNTTQTLTNKDLTDPSNTIGKDIQNATSTTTITTSSLSYVNMTGMSLTTSNLGSLTYLINFSANIGSNAGSSRYLECILMIDGSLITDTRRYIYIASTYARTSTTINWVQSIENNVEIKVQWRVSGGTGLAAERTLSIMGI